MVTAHTLVKNEERFVWYSVVSVINHVDEYLIWDTGSSDKTIEIIEEIVKLFPDKVKFKKLNLDFKEDEVRQQMLDETKSDWFIVVDGDEIWWEDSIRQLINEIKENGDKLESIVVPTVNLVGDMYHYQPKEAGKYNLLGMKGHYNLRAVNRKLPGLKSLGTHGLWGWTDGENKMIQDRDPKKIKFINTPYLHATHLQRAGDSRKETQVLKRSFKLKHEIGIEFNRDFYYPEVFFEKKPDIVPNIWKPMDFSFKLRSSIETPIRKFKRKYLPDKVGY